MEDQNEDNQEQSNTTIIYFFYCPNKAIEKKYKLSFFLFNEENSESSLFLKEYEKYDVKLNDGNYNIYIISTKINNNLYNFEYFNIIIDDEKQKFNTESYSLENEKDIFLLDLDFNENPKIKNLNFKEIYVHYNNFLNSQFKDKILQKKYDDFWDCILNSSYQKDISDYFFDILQKMISFDNENNKNNEKYGFSKLGNLFLIKRGEINENNNKEIEVLFKN